MNPTICKRVWTTEEDVILRETIEKYGPQRWSMISEHLPGRMGKQCRERWFNHLCPEVKKSEWTAEEDAAIFSGVEQQGTRWCEIVKSIPGRTDNAIKNRYNSIMRRQKATGMAKIGFSPPKADCKSPGSPNLGKRGWTQSSDIEPTAFRASIVDLATQLAFCTEDAEKDRLIGMLSKQMQYRSPPASPAHSTSSLDSEDTVGFPESDSESDAESVQWMSLLEMPQVCSPPKRQRSLTLTPLIVSEPEALSSESSPGMELDRLQDQISLDVFQDLFADSSQSPTATPSPFTKLTQECLTPSTLGALLVESF